MAVIKKDGNIMALPLSIKRGNPIPIDSTAVWYDYTELETYAASGATAYVGQICVYVNEDSSTAEAYMITTTSGTLVKLAQTTASGDLAEDVAELQGKVDEIMGTLEGLQLEDSPVDGQLVSAVTQTDGKIAVQRRPLVADDIPALAMDKVTGLSSALSGKQDTIEFNTPYDAGSNKAATMSDVNAAVSGLSGAMHYVGVSTTDPSTGTATVEDHPDFVSGDVVAYDNKEFVYDGSAWRELGNEGSYAVKGSIKDSDIAADAAIAQSKIAGLTGALAGKQDALTFNTEYNADTNKAATMADVGEKNFISSVNESEFEVSDKNLAIKEIAQSKVTGLTDALSSKVSSEVGKGLSTNDFTNELKGKLDNIEAGAQANKIESVTLVDGALTIDGKNVTIPVASTDSYGVVKSSAAAGKVAVGSDGTMSINSMNATKLYLDAGDVLVLSGGAADPSASVED